MKVAWTKQTKTDDPKKALEMSIAKWRFFTYCTRKQFDDKQDHLLRACGLCWFFDGCGPCCFDDACGTLLFPAMQNRNKCRDGKATLKDFHASARKVFEKLKSLR